MPVDQRTEDDADAAVQPQCRRLWPSDRDAVLDHFLRLDPETRANRFMAAVSDRVAFAYAERAFVNEGLMYGAFVDGTLRGVGELRPAGRNRVGLRLGTKAEGAFAVERDFRRTGMGSMLFRRVVAAARNRGVTELHVRCLTDNGPMRRLATRLGAELELMGPEIDGTMRLERPTPLSLWLESIVEAVDLTIAVVAPPLRAITARSGRA